MNQKVDVIDALSTQFVCPTCKSHGATVEKLKTSQTGMLTRPKQVATVSCHKCDYAEQVDLVLQKDRRNLSSFLDSIFSKVSIHMPSPPGPMG